MKKLSVVLLLAFVFVLSLSAVALAAVDDAGEQGIAYIELDASGVLQEGGFPQAASPKRGADPYAAAKETIYAGLLEHAESIDVREFAIPKESLGEIYLAVLNEHPDLFYVSRGCSYYQSADGTVSSILPVYDESVSEDDIAAFNDSVAYIISQIGPDWSDLQKYLFLHDYLVTHCEYDLTLQKHNAYDALVTGSAVCQGYALAYLYLCGLAGLEAHYVTSEGINHAWNLVTINDKQYYVDCTWDDPSNNWYEGYCEHEYFLRSRDAFGHTGEGGTVTDWVCDGAYIYDNVTGSTDYDEAWFIDVVTAIPMLGSQCAYAKPDDNATVWLRDIVSGSETGVSLEKESKWFVWAGSGFWSGNYSSLASLNGVYYYTTPTEIWSLSTTGEKEQVFALTQPEEGLGYIYGIVNDRGTLYYNLGTQGWNTTFTRVALDIVPAVVASGICGAEGDNLTWSLDENGVLTISGSGDMADYKGDDMPWIEVSDSITSVVIEPGVTSIGAYAFADCYGLTGATIPAGVTGIGDYAFADCFELTGVTIPDGVTEIGEAAFDGCESLTEITIPGSVENISFCAFSGCEGLTSVVIQDGVKSIDMDAFSLCTSLAEITIPVSVTSIGVEAFAGCDELADVNYGGSRAQWKDIEIAEGNEPLEEATIHYADSSYTPGDINGDGGVNNKDVTRLMRYIKYKDVEVVEAALDVNGDGIVNNKDVTRLMRYIKYHDVEIH